MPGITGIPIAIKYATFDQKKDPDFMFKSIIISEDKETISEEVMKHAHPDLKNNQEFLLKVIEAAAFIDPSKIMGHVPSHFKSNPEFMLAATERSPQTIRYISDSLKSNPAFILDANKITPIARECIDASLKNNPVFMSELTKKVSY
ncbi:MAG: DUF4116 domain-containing protein [Candidatus Rhabdochlamydia sp.]